MLLKKTEPKNQVTKNAAISRLKSNSAALAVRSRSKPSDGSVVRVLRMGKASPCPMTSTTTTHDKANLASLIARHPASLELRWLDRILSGGDR